MLLNKKVNEINDLRDSIDKKMREYDGKTI